MKVETIKERTLIKVFVRINLKQVHFPHFGIASRVVGTQAGVSSLDQAVDPNVFDNVQTSHCDGERNASVLRQLGDGRQQVIVGGMQSVGHFVTQSISVSCSDIFSQTGIVNTRDSTSNIAVGADEST